jgi:tetratricopeptide (TPR) repeat protein
MKPTTRRGYCLERHSPLADYNQALQFDPKNSLARNNRGLLKLARGDLDGALTDCNKSLELDPKCGTAYGVRGDVKQAKGDLGGALADMGYAVQGSTPCGWWVSCCETPLNGVPGPSGCGYCLQEHSPIADYDRAIELDPKFAGAYRGRGLVKRANGDLDGALADFNLALQVNPRFASAHVSRGNAKEAKGDLEEGVSRL